MINFIEEINGLLNEYDFHLKDVVFVVGGNTVENDEFLEKYNVFYENDYGICNFDNIQIIIYDHTWFERASYDGREKFVLKAHPLLSAFENQESHTDIFYRGSYDNTDMV